MANIELKNISKTYKNATKAVKNVSFSADEGDFVVLVGPSGCGKTTILRMIAGLEEISEGDLLFDNRRMNDVLPKDRDVGMVFQEYALYPHLSVFDNIAFPLKVKKINKHEIEKQVNQIAKMIGLNDYLKRKPAELSGGQRQRVALGRAIIRHPKIFLFDEPLSNLDAQLRIQMRQDIIALQRKVGITSVYVTHDQTEAMTMGTKIAVMKDGILQQYDTAQNIYCKPCNLFVADFIGYPQINLFAGKMNKNSFLEDGSMLELGISNENLFENRKYTLGIRPEKIFTGKNDAEKAINISVTVSNIEYLGSETILYFQTGNTAKRIKTSTNTHNIKINDAIFCHFFVEDILLFDEIGRLI